MKLLVCSVFVLSIAMTAAAQTTATLTGIVRDASGAVLPGVQVTVQQMETGAVRRTGTNADGRFTLTGLPAGDY